MSGITTPATRTATAMPLPILWNRPNLRFIEGAGDGGTTEVGDDKGKGSSFTAITTQEDLDKVLGDRLARERGKYSDYAQFKADSDELKQLKAANATDQDKALEAAREEGRNEFRGQLVTERVTAALKDALTGRIPDAGALIGLDLGQFAKDGKADTDAIKAWAGQHSTEVQAEKRQKDQAQGRRDSGSSASGSTSAGREAFERRHSKKSTSN